MRDFETSEKWVESTLGKRVKKLGGQCLKWVSPQTTGVPDRIVLIPGGRIFFVETKSAGKELSPRQRIVRKILVSLGFEYFKISSRQDIDDFVSYVESGIKI